MPTTPLDEFLAYELTESIRSQLLTAIEQMKSGTRTFTYNTFDVEENIATVNTVLYIDRRTRVSFSEFAELLRPPGLDRPGR